jgi:hypothetical protein
MDTAVHPEIKAAFIIVAFVLAALPHTIWLRTRASMRLGVPLDGGLRLRGRRVFGDHKMIRGFVVIVPAAGIAFALTGAVFSRLGLGAGLWGLGPTGEVLLGMWAATGFMAGELPNSFLKRRLGVAPGAVPTGAWTRPVFLVLDRVDSLLGMLLALSVAVPVSWTVWVYVLIVGPGIHLLFSAVFFALGTKERFA